MGKVIILAGAPDAASLGWSAMAQRAETGAAQTWEDSGDINDNSIAASLFDRPQWRIVPTKGAASEVHVSCEADPANEGGQNAPGEVAATSPGVLHGRAEFMTLVPMTQDSTQISAEDGRGWHAVSFGQSTLDEASLSLRLPDALPATTSPQLPPRPYPAPSSDGYTDGPSTSQAFIEHSLAVHDALPSSLPPFDLPEVHRPASFDETTLSLSQPASMSVISTAPPLPTDIPRWQPLTQLVDVPSAAYLLSLAPQTVTVNLVVAIVSVGAPRVVGNSDKNNKTGRRDRPPVSLVELVVGDETKSGFGLTIWLDGGQQPAAQSSLAALLPTLAPHDVVLLRHVALHVFGDKVYGSSLRKDQTKIHILHRGRQTMPRKQTPAPQGDALFSPAHIAAAAHRNAQEDPSLPAGWQLLEKTARVRNWALRYVLVDGAPVGGGTNDAQGVVGDDERRARSKTTPAWMLPPPDTQ